jgi:RNA polymerase sigma factor for flagellar operon FliA
MHRAPSAPSAPSSASRPELDPATASRNELILEYYPMVRRVAYRMAKRFPRCVDADDLVHIGLLGLIDAVDRFETERTQSFSAYARIRVQGAIVDEMRKNDWVPRSVRDRAARLDRARAELKEQLGRAPTSEELATFLGVDEERLMELQRTADVRVLVSTEEGDDDEGTVGETLKSEAEDIDQIILQRDTNANVRRALLELPPREQTIIEMHYHREQTFKEIAVVLGVTESRVSQLHTRMKQRLAEKLAQFAV